VHVIKGTECHTRNDEIRIGKVLGASKNPENGTKRMGQSWTLSLTERWSTSRIISPQRLRPYLEASAHSIALGVINSFPRTGGQACPSVICPSASARHGIWTDGNQAIAHNWRVAGSYTPWLQGSARRYHGSHPA